MAVKVVLRAIPKTVDLGKLDVGATSDSSTELECSYLKLTLDGRDRIELDKFNFIYKVDDVDYLALVRANLGM
jgi:P2 family phage contractile tail tube protein